MILSPAGKFGTLISDGTPQGLVVDARVSTVDATSSSGDVIFEGAKRGRRYCVEGVCPSGACWATSGFLSLVGPEGHVGSGSPGEPFGSAIFGELVAKPPGTGWQRVGANTLLVQAAEDGDILGAMADDSYADNVGEMTVIVYEISPVFGPPEGHLDVPIPLSITATGGAIPETGTGGPDGFSRFQINVQEKGIINDVDFLLLESLVHDFANDLIIRIISPSGVKVTVANRVGHGTVHADKDYSGDYTFVEAGGSPPQFSSTDVVPGEYSSDQSFAALIGQPVTGLWTLEIHDLNEFDTGSLGSWTLQLKYGAIDKGIFEPREEQPLLVLKQYQNVDFFSIPTGGGGSWSSTLPVDPAIVPLIVPDVGTVTRLVNVKLESFSHTKPGDLHLVLVSPSGTKITIFHRPGSTSGSAGNSAGFDFGDYEFVDSGASLLPDAALISPGTYSRDPGDWPGLPNDQDVLVGDFDTFAGEDATGIWYLFMYDWDASDGGSFDGPSITLEISVS